MIRPATEAEKRILARAAKTRDGKLFCPPDYCVRLWMTHLSQMSKKGYIYRLNTSPYITDAGRLAITQPTVRAHVRTRAV
jgi:hypothetical protein